MTSSSNRYSQRYLKIYFWQALSISLGFLSMFIVTPFLSGNPRIFGIYSICVSLTIFLSYADLGFLGAGQKYAAEEFAKGDLDSERRVIGFSGFVLLAFVGLCSLVFVFLSMNPQWLIPRISDGDVATASLLLLLLGVGAPSIVVLRITQLVFSVRIEDYVYQRIVIVGSLFKIGSTFWFFRPGTYDIVGYFFVVQVTNYAVGAIALLVATKRFHFSLAKLISSFRFSRSLFEKTQKLAFNSLFLTVSWILYYEIDTIVIGQIWGPEEIAVYAVGLTLLSFLRSILGSFFVPFLNRFNHFVGVGDLEGLKRIFRQVVSISFSIIPLGILVVILFMGPLILSWVGPHYSGAVSIAQLLIACNLFAFVSYPVGILLSAQERVKILYVVGILSPVVYWVGILVGYQSLGVNVFAVMKFVVFLLSAIVNLVIFQRFTLLSRKQALDDFLIPWLPALLVCLVFSLWLPGLLPTTRDHWALIENGAVVTVVAIASILTALWMNRSAREFLASLLPNRT